jgi:hypothetical protein
LSFSSDCDTRNCILIAKLWRKLPPNTNESQGV